MVEGRQQRNPPMLSREDVRNLGKNELQVIAQNDIDEEL